MPNINLATAEEYSKNNSQPVGKGLIVASAILVLLVVLYGALFFVNRALSEKIKLTQDEYAIESENFLSGNGNQIFDFKNRSVSAEKMIAENRAMGEILSQIESSMLPLVYLNSLKYDETKKTLSLLCVGDNFQTVAKQVLSFKQNEYFSAVIPSRSFLDSANGNKLNFSIDLVIK